MEISPLHKIIYANWHLRFKWQYENSKTDYKMIPTYGYLAIGHIIALLIKNVIFLFLFFTDKLQTANISFSKRVSKTRHSHLILIQYYMHFDKKIYIYSKITCSEIANFKNSKIGTCLKYVRTSYFFSQRMKKKIANKIE